MTKLEKVIKGLACCTTIDVDGYPICGECPYFRDESCPDLDEMHTDALELLKAQELQREYEAAVEDQRYCERYEPTYNPDDGSM